MAKKHIVIAPGIYDVVIDRVRKVRGKNAYRMHMLVDPAISKLTINSTDVHLPTPVPKTFKLETIMVPGPVDVPGVTNHALTVAQAAGRMLRPTNHFVQHGAMRYRICTHGAKVLLIGYVAKGRTKEKFLNLNSIKARSLVMRFRDELSYEIKDISPGGTTIKVVPTL